MDALLLRYLIMGRVTLLTDEVQAAICESLSRGAYFKAALAAAGVDEDTGREWRARGRGTDPDRGDETGVYAAFAAAVEEAKGRKVTSCTGKIFDLGMEKDDLPLVIQNVNDDLLRSEGLVQVAFDDRG